MNYFSSHSEKALSTCHPDLQTIMRLAIKEMDFSVFCGYRNEADQNTAYDGGFSKLRFPESNHNVFPSGAVDVVPYPVDWKDTVRFVELSHVIKRIAKEHNIAIRWGGDFVSFFDGAHYELIDKEQDKE